MSADESGLGGRLPLYGRRALEPAQQELDDWLINVAVPRAMRADFQASTEAGLYHIVCAILNTFAIPAPS
jgi:4-carboxymuconolactone decarboxylase